MADEQLESAASPEIQSVAERIGWQPPSRYKGPADRFEDADAFIERMGKIVPELKKTNDGLRSDLTNLRGQTAAQAAAIKDAQAAISDMEERHSAETARAVEAAKRQVKAQLAKASEAGDHEGVAELTEQMVALNAATEDEPPKKVMKEEKPASFQPESWLLAWNARHPEFGKDPVTDALFQGYAAKLRQEGDRSLNEEFLDKVAERVKAHGKPPARTEDRVEGNRGGNGARSGGKTYDDLPADAKAVCQADTRKFVGEGKRYKTAAEWHSAFANLFFKE